ncbi:hypothetical protein A6R68_07235, partial [Neotoma lepida]
MFDYDITMFDYDFIMLYYDITMTPVCFIYYDLIILHYDITLLYYDITLFYYDFTVLYYYITVLYHDINIFHHYITIHYDNTLVHDGITILYYEITLVHFDITINYYDITKLSIYRYRHSGHRQNQSSWSLPGAEQDGGPPQETTPSLFLVSINPGGNCPLAWYPWEAQDLKDLKKVVLEDGPNSPWAETILLGLAYQALMTQDWRNLAKAVLSDPLYLKWNACFQKQCHLQAERNQAANPQIPITFGMLAGTSDQYSTGLQQAALAAPYQDQHQQGSWTLPPPLVELHCSGAVLTSLQAGEIPPFTLYTFTVVAVHEDPFCHATPSTRIPSPLPTFPSNPSRLQRHRNHHKDYAEEKRFHVDFLNISRMEKKLQIHSIRTKAFPEDAKLHWTGETRKNEYYRLTKVASTLEDTYGAVNEDGEKATVKPEEESLYLS